jgi:thiamine biosynthesis lipoprotein
MSNFEHVEECMGTVFRFAGRTDLDAQTLASVIQDACTQLHEADDIFSTYKPNSPISRLARGETNLAGCPPVVADIWDACDEWQSKTNGWFNAMTPQNTFDPSGLVKTWAAQNAANALLAAGITDFTMNAGGDVLISDGASQDIDWRIGISKTVSIASPDAGVLTVIDLQGTDFRALATSGSAERGDHIWNPKALSSGAPKELLQVSVVARDLVTADVWATAAFAEGARAVDHLDKIDVIEALFVFANGELAATSGFSQLFAKHGLGH